MGKDTKGHGSDKKGSVTSRGPAMDPKKANEPHGYHVFDARGAHTMRTEDKKAALAAAKKTPGASVFPIHDAMRYYGQSSLPSAFSEHRFSYPTAVAPIHVTKPKPRDT